MLSAAPPADDKKHEPSKLAILREMHEKIVKAKKEDARDPQGFYTILSLSTDQLFKMSPPKAADAVNERLEHKQFHQLQLLYHPDKYPQGSEEKELANKLCPVLLGAQSAFKDDGKFIYDQKGVHRREGKFAAPPPAASAAASSTNNERANSLRSCAWGTAEVGAIMAFLGGWAGYCTSDVATIPFVAAAGYAKHSLETGLLQAAVGAAPGVVLITGACICGCVVCCCLPEQAVSAPAPRVVASALANEELAAAPVSVMTLALVPEAAASNHHACMFSPRRSAIRSGSAAPNSVADVLPSYGR